MADTVLLREIVEELEWSDTAVGQGTSMGADNGTHYPDARCLTCGGLDPNYPELRGEWMESAFGHRSGCRVALALGRETIIPEGESGSLAL